jgi:DNA end-binding protein Ku
MPRTAATKTAGKTTARKSTAKGGPASAARAAGSGGRARPIWSGTLSFGLISIPVALAPAIRDTEGRVAFHLLDSRDLKRLRRELFCPADNKVIDNPRDIARGVEVKPGKWVTVEDEELRAAAPKRSSSIEILDFVPLGEIDPLYYDHPYLVIPGGALKPYRLLVEVLAADNLAGIARFVLHAREHYVALRVLEDQLVLITLRYQDQLRTPEGLELEAKPEAKAVKAVLSAIGKLKGTFDPTLLEDDTNEKVMALIEKLKSQATDSAPPKSAARPSTRKPSPKDDLAEQLEASVAQARQRRGGAKSARKPPADKPAAKTTARASTAARRRKLKVVE